MIKIKEKRLIIILLGLSVGTYYLVDTIWSQCVQNNCSQSLINNFLSPLTPGSIILSGFFTIFLLLPTHYFQAWFKWIFSWAFPVAIFSVIVTNDSGEVLSFSRALVAQLCGAFFGVVTLLFVLYHFFSSRKKSKKII